MLTDGRVKGYVLRYFAPVTYQRTGLSPAVERGRSTAGDKLMSSILSSI